MPVDHISRDLLPEPPPIEERLSNARWFGECSDYDGTDVMVYVRGLIESGEAVYSDGCIQMTRLGYDRASSRSWH